ncbi:uncharacterized protein ARMOST_21234 [Armillaria ostoyae]|uniref:Uncharacterized protein n=1 Tax=Armillaria ostoyae TaxID=47428 RepID=A0A284S9I6_ARMOS|nr:uncharacterized protein ARMOST_21234 [Armillaria ostoyae]
MAAYVIKLRKIAENDM